MTIWTIAVILAAIAGMEGLRRARANRLSRDDGLTDDMIRRIENEGEIEVEDPLDMETIEEEESKFWEETWDEPEEP
ncbi:MAG: hypothetical protein L0271_11465 [Gemmatimonadetes bacterium]|nr:hypothetical protein [Gemmatimonadota bacterium]